MDFLFIILFFSFSVFVLGFMNRTGFKLSYVTIPTISINAIFVFSYIGIFFLYFGLDAYRSVIIQNREIIFKMLLYSCTAIFGVVAGNVIAKSVLKIRLNSFSVNIFRPLYPSERYILLIFFVVCIAIMALYLKKCNEIALFVLLHDGAVAARKARSNMGNNFHGAYWRYSFFFAELLPVLAYSFYADWLLRKKSTGSFYRLVIILIPACFSAVLAIEKAPLIWFLLGMIFTYIIVKRKGVISIYAMLKVGFFLSLILIIFYMQFMGVNDPFKALASIGSRAFDGGLHPLYFYLKFFPDYHEYLSGKSFPNPAGIFPYEPFRLTVEVMNWMHPDLAAKGIVGSAPTVFWGEIYANFGFLPVFIFSIMLGVYLYIIHVIIMMLPNTPVKIGVYVWLIMHYFHLCQTGLFSFIFDIKLILMVSVFIFYYIVVQKAKLKFIHMTHYRRLSFK